MRTKIVLAGLAATSLAVVTACGSSSTNTGTSHANSALSNPSTPMSSGMVSTPSSSDAGMGGMPMSAGNGLAPTDNGYALTVTSQPMTGMAMPVTFTITKSGTPVTAFDPEQTKLMHFYLIRSDLSGFQHLHPTMNSTGTWSVTPAALSPGSYRIYTQFLPHADNAAGALVLSRPVTIAGSSEPSSTLPAPSTIAIVDGYTLTLAGTPKAGAETPLQINISKAGQPVTDLQPYLDTYAHVTAIRQGDLAFAHLHPTDTVTGDHGGPTLTINADLPEAGNYRIFVQFQTAGTLHTAAITITVMR
jgi:hypothetical protein